MRRRRPKPERVRHTLREMPPSLLADEYGEKIVALRGYMHRALIQIDAGEPDIARRTLAEGLEERWWRR